MSETVAILEHIPSGQFRQYNKGFQETIFQGLLTDHQWGIQMIEVMRPDFFEVKYLVFLCEKYFAYFQKYKCFHFPLKK